MYVQIDSKRELDFFQSSNQAEQDLDKQMRPSQGERALLGGSENRFIEILANGAQNSTARKLANSAKMCRIG